MTVSIHLINSGMIAIILITVVLHYVHYTGMAKYRRFKDRLLIAQERCLLDIMKLCQAVVDDSRNEALERVKVTIENDRIELTNAFNAFVDQYHKMNGRRQ